MLNSRVRVVHNANDLDMENEPKDLMVRTEESYIRYDHRERGRVNPNNL
jgi:hypothetical protein